MGRVVLIGVDGMDHAFVTENLDKLPNCGRLSKTGYLGPLKSVFPADSIPSWITIFTGTGPDEHGIVQSIDYLKKDYKSFAIDTDVFKGRTFWDAASSQGRKVCVINPFLAYPVWEVNGIMINGPVFISGDNQGYPSGILEKYPSTPSLGGIVDFPKKKTLASFVEKTTADTSQLALYAKELFLKEEWDLFFVSFFTLDRLQHFLWRYSDEKDPTYPGVTRHKEAILDLYKEFDAIAGSFLRILDPNDTLLVLSDHGHSMRCTKLLNLNEFLRKKGYLQTKAPIPLLSKNYWLEKTKNISLQMLYRLRLEEYSYLVTKLIKNPKKLKTSAHVINDEVSVACLSDFAGMGPFGGISICEKVKKGNGYERTRGTIIHELKTLNEENGGKLFKWIKKNDELYAGEYISVYPDIIFELSDGLGVNWALYLPLIIKNPFHRRISGGHTSNGVLAVNHRCLLDESKYYNVKDVYRLVMSGLGIA